MNVQIGSPRYSGSRIALHWLSLSLVLAAFASMEFEDAFGRGEPRRVLESLHYSIGLSLMLLTVVRLGLRAFGRGPGALPGTPHWQRVLASMVHVALYAWLIAMPLSGWALAEADGNSVTLFGLPWPSLGGWTADREHTLEDLHEALASVGYALIGLHAAAALVHQFALRDGSLSRMLPWAAAGRAG
jgi:superoxide oxidase